MSDRAYYSIILKNLLQYIPSRVLIILNSLIIVPFFTYVLNKQEVSIYLTSIFILNLICTASFDWISKAVLRFYTKYKFGGKIDIFISTIFKISTAIYAIILVLYLLFKDLLFSHFDLTSLQSLLVVLLVLPCGLRQSLYQILRLKNNYWLYTVSIILYQILFIIIFLAMVHFVPNATSVIISMLIAITIIDAYLLKFTNEKFNIKQNFDKSICTEIFKYSMPLIFTNILYWLILYVPNMIFQSHNMYNISAIFGIALVIINNTVQPCAGLFSFINFPMVVRCYDLNKNFDNYHTSTIQLYLCFLLPIVLCFVFFSKNIVHIFLPESYSMVAVILPILGFKIFVHELLKLVTIKYHLQNKTYIELIIALIIVGIGLYLNFKFALQVSVTYVAAVILITEICLIISNILIKYNIIKYIDYKKIFKTAFKLIAISFLSYIIIRIICPYENTLLSVFKIILYFGINYVAYYLFRKQILV